MTRFSITSASFSFRLPFLLGLLCLGGPLSLSAQLAISGVAQDSVCLGTVLDVYGDDFHKSNGGGGNLNVDAFLDGTAILINSSNDSILQVEIPSNSAPGPAWLRLEEQNGNDWDSVWIYIYGVTTVDYPNQPYCQHPTHQVAPLVNNGPVTFSTSFNGVNTVDPNSGLATISQLGNTMVNWTSVNCPNQFGPVLLDVDPGNIPSQLQYSLDSVCQNRIPNTIMPMVVSPVGGQFYSPTGLNVDPFTGLVTLGSQSGIHQVVYAPAYGGCYRSDTFQINILSEDDASIAYGDNVFCLFENDPFPVLGSPGGQIAVPVNSAAIVNPLSGQLDLAASLAQQVTSNAPIAINYTVQQQCPSQSTAFVTVHGDSAYFEIAPVACQGLGGIAYAANVGGRGTFSLGGNLVPAGNLNVVGATVLHPLVDIVQSSPGIDMITFALDSSLLGCYQEYQLPLNVVPVPNLNIQYSDTLYCKGEAAQFPSILSPPPPGEFYSSVPGIDLGNIQGKITPANSQPGVYPVNYIPFGALCPDTVLLTEIVIQVDSLPSIDFGLVGNGQVLSFCANQSNFSPAPQVVPPGGTFSSAGGLTVNSNTGVIDLGNSTSNQPFQLTYDPPGSRCFKTDSMPIMVEDFDAFFAYESDSICTFFPALAIDSLTRQAPPGHTETFSVTGAGISIDASSGLINPQQSLPGIYPVELTMATPSCSETFSAASFVTILPAPDPVFTYNLTNNRVCLNASNHPLPDSSRQLGGFFQVVSGGCQVDSASGEILLDQSSTGPCAIRYEFPSYCPESFELTVNILPPDEVAFDYPQDTFCTTIEDTILPMLTPGFVGGNTFTPSASGINMIDFTTGAISPGLGQPGSYVITYNSAGAPSSLCPVIARDTVVINNGTNPIFLYRDSVLCQSSGNALVDSSSLPVLTGTYSSGAGIDLHPFTGVVDLSESTPGLYSIKFAPSVGQYCPDTLTAQVRIVAEDVLTEMVYPGDTFCEASGILRPDWVGDSSGVFTASQGVIWNDRTAGAVDLDQTLPGTYSVRYQLGGVCAEFWDHELIVGGRENADFWYVQDTFCPNEPFPVPMFIATPGGAYSAEPGLIVDGISGQIHLENSLPGTYEVYYETPGLCSRTGTFIATRLDDIEPLNWDIFPDSVICQDDSIEVATRFSTNIEFFVNGVSVENQFPEYTFHGLESGDEIEVGYSQDGLCFDTVGFAATVRLIPSLDLGKDTAIELNGTDLQLELKGNTSDMWVHWEAVLDTGAMISPSSGLINFNGEENQNFQATVETVFDFFPASLSLFLVPSNELCIGDTDTIRVRINPAETRIFIPEVFTPNFDGFNDTWKIQWIDDVNPSDYHLELFNRSYGKVLDMQPLRDTWNGNGLPDGVYRWVLRTSQGDLIRTGGVTLRRK